MQEGEHPSSSPALPSWRPFGQAGYYKKDGGISADPNEIAAALTDHWSQVFTARPTTHQHILDDWMKTRPYGFNEAQSKDRECWRISTRHVEMAVSMSNNSSPGPDGIPYAAWRHAGRTAILILHAAAEQMQAPDFRNTRLPTGFNDNYLCCLPNKPSGTDQVAGDYFLPSATRPLSLVNTDN